MTTVDTATSLLQELYALLDRTLTPDEVAARLVMSPSVVMRQAGKGRIPGGFKVGRSWRFRAAPFTAWSRGWWHPERCDFDTWFTALQHGMVMK